MRLRHEQQVSFQRPKGDRAAYQRCPTAQKSDGGLTVLSKRDLRIDGTSKGDLENLRDLIDNGSSIMLELENMIDDEFKCLTQDHLDGKLKVHRMT